MFTILTTWRLPDKKSSAQFQVDLLSFRSFKASFDIFIVLKVELWTINQYTHPSKCMNSSRAVCKVGEVVSLICLFSMKLQRVQGFVNDVVSRGHKWPQFDSSYSILFETDWNLRSKNSWKCLCKLGPAVLRTRSEMPSGCITCCHLLRTLNTACKFPDFTEIILLAWYNGSRFQKFDSVIKQTINVCL